MSQITTHVLDSALGKPAAGVPVALFQNGELIADGRTDADGRVASLGPDVLAEGGYTLLFDVAAYFGDRQSFYPRVIIDFVITGGEHYHVPLLLSPFAYSTYRGS
jgi:5-hydroxyisourate hydrolase